MARGGLGREFRWLWTAYAVSAFGTRLSFDAFPLIAVLVLRVGPTQVSALAATGLAVGAVVALQLGPWVEFRRKRPVMMTMDLVRCAALLTVPAAYALDLLTFPQLLLVSMVVAVADITFTAASGAFLKSLVPPEHLVAANGRFEATTWTTTMLGPPLGGAAMGLFGPVVTLLIDATSYLLSAAGIRAIGDREPHPARTAPPTHTAEVAGAGASETAAGAVGAAVPAAPATQKTPTAPTAPTTPKTSTPRLRPTDLLDGWRFLLADPALRSLFLNTIVVNALIMAPAPLLLILMVGELGFAPWQYGLAFAVPCAGGLIGSRLSRRLVARHGDDRVLRVAGTLRACWPLGLAFIGHGPAGLVLVMVVELGLITCISVFNPVMATQRLTRTPSDRVARVLTAWSVTGKLATAATTALWGLLAALTTPRTAIATAGLLLLATPLLLLTHRHRPGGAPRIPAPNDHQNPEPLQKN
ncbi:MFS transporter [Streptomyces stelliscabiei]|uniref:Putative MFS family arabinose efflux permease n=1 Tax=Streptomyces stelliscabiei TaxID=146820 RepID=A0A8I0P903_9ACTN|nr:MFS transporter [Streptomyces stelliscabiei]KND45674.1 MFS transporter [Streptomyces stelliscabiei]MBE1598140.1 putative MFS family arabinose efflux permease [Streptomyces stelliscabiei]MDX2521024.1 MFS transporter [Streptomyces stelliscabiei]